MVLVRKVIAIVHSQKIFFSSSSTGRKTALPSTLQDQSFSRRNSLWSPWTDELEKSQGWTFSTPYERTTIDFDRLRPFLEAACSIEECRFTANENDLELSEQLR